MLQEAAVFLRGRKKVNLSMVGINIVVFLILSLLGDTENAGFMFDHGACYAPAVMEGEYWRLLTSMFLHFGIVHLVYNMLCLIYLGDILETAVGPIRYFIIYLGGGLAGGLLSVLWENMTQNYAVSAGASGAIFAVIGACLWIARSNHGRLGSIPVKRLGIMSVLMIAEGFTTAGTDNAAHIGGFAGGLLLAAAVYRSSVRRQ